jgi:hypothetical protein
MQIRKWRKNKKSGDARACLTVDLFLLRATVGGLISRIPLQWRRAVPHPTIPEGRF